MAICDRVTDELASTEADVAACGARPLARVLDVRDTEATTAFVAEVGDRHGRVDVLVNNAGGTFFAPFLELSAGGAAVRTRR